MISNSNKLVTNQLIPSNEIIQMDLIQVAGKILPWCTTQKINSKKLTNFIDLNYKAYGIALLP